MSPPAIRSVTVAPATGSPGLDLPIDVVESVQVISNPYDPQYGKLTGAVSSIGTKTSAFDKLHFSIQNVMPRARVRDGTVSGVGVVVKRALTAHSRPSAPGRSHAMSSP